MASHSNSPSPSKPPLPRRPSESNHKIVPSFDQFSDNTLIHVIQFPKDHVIKDPPTENYQKIITYSTTRPNRRRIIRNFHRFLCASLCAAILIVIILCIAIYVSFRPQAPSYSLTSLSVSGFDNLLSSPTTPLNPIFNASIQTENPNKRLSVIYQNGGTVSISFDGVELCNGDWPAFVQKPHNTTKFGTGLTGSSILLTASTRNSILKAENNSMVPLTMDGKFPVKMKWSFVKSWSVTVKISCDLTVDALNTTTTVLRKNCRLNTHYLW